MREGQASGKKIGRSSCMDLGANSYIVKSYGFRVRECHSYLYYIRNIVYPRVEPKENVTFSINVPSYRAESIN